ncbi:hypothetical protein SERLA73DRAFT_162245 [Serpula lacrymans var. lacrymans S7.3]|uniref:DUF6593 domain-containing protein n=2 Tax=Serpula lacrymans var. lacrymans TaxID=341189 RepID=F8Q5J0_SERL3|nr:uncharacterized protein SERLADRAFT_451988 [Serpula lacrymans var. lacrymans S7.9]EGN96461.1 hypothetical protein SERLA73DRAFT_162245 [Serpula lacrymans var. lacrymans S7.3]EGO22011.1 hypothetical protein SERLADRAFT_451988 [Serpula lacrymans var. lacrymans S7.9]
MDSQVTLVDPAILALASIILDFDRDDMKRTTIRIRGATSTQPYYYVETTKSDSRTVVRTGDHVIATVERRDIFPDQITFKGSQSMNLSKWLKSPKMAKFPISFVKDEKRYEWRINFIGQVALYEEGAAVTDAIAWFQASRKRVVDGRPVVYNALLALKPEADLMRDTVLVSCLLVEQKARMNAKANELAVGRAIFEETGLIAGSPF